MKVSSEDADNIIRISIDGDIEMGNIKFLKSEIMYIAEREERNIEIDFTSVHFLDSSGIGLLLALYKYQNTKGKTLRLTHVPEQISRVLQLTSLEAIL